MDGSSPSAGDGGGAGLAGMERALRRALAVSDSEEARFNIRTALQFLAVVRDGVRDPQSRSGVESGRP